MAVDPAIVDANAEQTRRLEELISRLTDADLERDLGEGWTVSVALAHAAFWDRRAARVFERWTREGTPYRDQDDDILNEALLDEWRLLPGRVVIGMVLAAARSVDAAVQTLPDNIAAALIASGDEFLLRRSNHRREHIEQIEAVLAQ
jgi:hypothetical protein